MELHNATSFHLLGKRWSALIVQDLESGPRRFRELLWHVGRINDKVLSQRLKELEEASIVRREVFAEVPTRVEYSLSDKGNALLSIIREMERWDASWVRGTMPMTQQSAQRPSLPSSAVPTPKRSPVVAAARQSPREGGPLEGVRGLWKRLGL